MKKSILTLLTALFVISGCNTFKKVFERSELTKTQEKSKETIRDSVHIAAETLPTSNLIVLTEEDFKLRGDFEQSVSSGQNKTTIRKEGGKVYIKNDNAGTKSVTTKTKENINEQNSYVETFISEYKKIIHRMPIRYYLYMAIAVLIWQRKLVSQILVSFFPGLGAKRIFKLFLGQKLD